ncbi:MAG: hypothetical protein RBS40_12350 [Rhodocyclaceae bacterium]|jgi:hypothetical protein|nr:hypothetical protein [Rhodocyclaceae bacterium]
MKNWGQTTINNDYQENGLLVSLADTKKAKKGQTAINRPSPAGVGAVRPATAWAPVMETTTASGQVKGPLTYGEPKPVEGQRGSVRW